MRNLRTLLLLVAMLMVASLAACAPAPAATDEPEDTSDNESTDNTDATEEAGEEPETSDGDQVVITWWHITTAENQKAVWQKLADEYMAEHPNVTIEITVLENEAFKTKLTTVMQSGEPPDIFQSWGGGTMNEQAEAGLLMDITADLEADGWGETFAPGALGVYSYNGVNYGVPWDMGMVGVWYNKALFTEAGLDPENPPATWDEFLAAVDALKEAGITPIAVGAGDKWPSAFWWEYLVTRIGGQEAFAAAADRSGSFADPAFVEAGERMIELIEREPFQDGFLGATWGDEATLMGNGQAAMDVMGQWAPGAFNDNSVDKLGIGENLGWFPFPMVDGGAGDPNDAVGGGNGFAIGKDAEPEVIDFVKYLTRAESQIQCAQEGFCIPVVDGGEEGLSDPLMITIQQSLAQAQYFQLYYDQALTPALGSVVNDSVQGLFAGTLSPEEAAQAIEDSAQQELD